MTQTVDAVAHDEPHGAGIVVRPDGFGTVALLRLEESVSGLVKGIRPGELLPSALAFGALPLQGLEQAGRMMNALGIAAHLLADDARCVAVGFGAANTADRMAVENLDLERAGRRTVMRADGEPGLDVLANVHLGS